MLKEKHIICEVSRSSLFRATHLGWVWGRVVMRCYCIRPHEPHSIPPSFGQRTGFVEPDDFSPSHDEHRAIIKKKPPRKSQIQSRCHRIPRRGGGLTCPSLSSCHRHEGGRNPKTTTPPMRPRSNVASQVGNMYPGLHMCCYTTHHLCTLQSTGLSLSLTPIFSPPQRPHGISACLCDS